MRHSFSVLSVGLAALLAGCGGGDDHGHGNGNPQPQFSVGGTLAGLSGSVVLQDDGGDNLTLSSSGPFTFATSLQLYSFYDITVAQQPSGQVCAVGNGAGTVTAAVTNVSVVCTSGSALSGQWTWHSGSTQVDAAGVYGTLGTPAAGNVPGAREMPTSWTDGAGNFWLFGGWGADSADNGGELNDLWKYSPSSGEWTWESGASTADGAASYGTQGVAAATNVPGAREGAAQWVDATGTLWMFGGGGEDSNQNPLMFNDLWKYIPSSGQWTWVGGANNPGGAGSYGTQAVAAAGNLPPPRSNAMTWIDSSGVLWLFGGAQYTASGNISVYDDLWSYNPTSGLWTWVGGSNAQNGAGIYGAQGDAAATNLPGARMGAALWVDASGKIWLFGGLGFDQSQNGGELNDLWRYDPTSSQWTWIGGSTAINANGLYGTTGAGSAGNLPGARVTPLSWMDASGNLWLFGGYGFDQLGNADDLSDLWEYNPTSGVWTWVSGSSFAASAGTYGSQGTPSANNAPGAREQSVGWTDSSGNFWLFGGFGYDGAGNQDALNDLWSFTPTP